MNNRVKHNYDNVKNGLLYIRNDNISDSNTLISIITIILLSIFGIVIYFSARISFNLITSEYLSHPLKRFIYVILTLVLIPVVFISTNIVNKFLYDGYLTDNLRKYQMYYAGILIALPILLTVSTFFEMKKFAFFVFESKYTISFYIISEIIGFIFIKQLKKNYYKKVNRSILALLLCIILIYSVVSFRVYDIHHVDDSFSMAVHLEAILYSISQVAAGKSVLGNLPAQYGLYAEFLKPIFLYFRPSVLNFTISMAVIEITCLFLIMKICFSSIKSNVLLVLCMLSLFSLAGLTWFAPIEPYFQYFPIRFIFPALASTVYFFTSKKMNLTYGMLLGFIAGIAVFFNLDSGVPVFGSLAISLFATVIFTKDKYRRSAINNIGLFFASFLFTSLIIILYMKIKIGSTVHWDYLIKYQLYFFIDGAYMLPLPKTSYLWILVVTTYIFGISNYIFYKKNNKNFKDADFILFLSVLGLGLLSYYMGRSHIITLLLCMWPSILIALIMSDRTLRAVNFGILPSGYRYLALPVIFLTIFFSCTFVFKIPVLTDAMNENFHLETAHIETKETNSIRFIKDHVDNRDSVVIIAPHQAAYYAETGLASAVDGPGIVENLLITDRTSYIRELVDHPVKHLFFKFDKNFIASQYQQLLEGPYKLKATSKYGMLYLEGF